MDNNIKNFLNDFFAKNEALCMNLKKWIAVKNKPFSLLKALYAVYNFCEGSPSKMKDVLAQMREEGKRKVQGRSQVHNTTPNDGIDIVDNGNGDLLVIGYAPQRQQVLKGQHVVDDPIKTKSGAVSKTVKRSMDTLENTGEAIRRLYPNIDVNDLRKIEIAIYNYARRKKKSQAAIVNALENGRLRLTDDFQIKGKANDDLKESRTIIINEEVAQNLIDDLTMTEYKFNSNIKQFLHDLLVDPVNAQPSDLLQCNGLDRIGLIQKLIDLAIIEKIEKIKDKDENNNPITATMIVKFNVPKQRFKQKLKNLFIELFESNLNECDGGGATGGDAGGSSGGGEGTSTFTLGGDGQYPYYDTPTFGLVRRGDPSLKRKKNGSISIERKK